MIFSVESIAKWLGRHADNVGSAAPEVQLGSYISGESESYNRLMVTRCYTIPDDCCAITADKQVVLGACLGVVVYVGTPETGKYIDVYDGTSAAGGKYKRRIPAGVSGEYFVDCLFTTGVYVDVDSSSATFSVGYIPQV